MAKYVVEVTNLPRWPGTVAAVIVVMVCIGSISALGLRAGGRSMLSPADLAALRFTLLQALLSASLSVVLAIPVARALARRQFPGRSFIITMLGAPFILPVLVAVLGLLAIFGRNGLINQGLEGVGLPRLDIYGLHGVVLAHVFLNMPLAVRLLFQGWLSIPAERFRLAASLGAPVSALLERPMLLAVVPGAFMTIFLLCLSSFAVALTLGGGPGATTIELAIYQALRFDFDPGKAAFLALVQFGISLGIIAIAWKVTLRDPLVGGLDRTVARWDDGRWSRLADGLVLGMATMFLFTPLLAIVMRGIPGLAEMPASVWPAALRSVLVALASVALCVTMALALSLRSGAVPAVTGVFPLAFSPFVLGTGLYLMLSSVVDPATLILPLTVAVNALLSLPFAYRIIAPAVQRSEDAYGRIATSLGLTGMARVRLVILPRIRGPLAFAAGLAAALSMGDLGVIVLVANDEQATLPLVIQRLMGSFRMEAAAGAGLLLIGLSLALFWVFDRGGRADADA